MTPERKVLKAQKSHNQIIKVRGCTAQADDPAESKEPDVDDAEDAAEKASKNANKEASAAEGKEEDELEIYWLAQEEDAEDEALSADGEEGEEAFMKAADAENKVLAEGGDDEVAQDEVLTGLGEDDEDAKEVEADASEKEGAVVEGDDGEDAIREETAEGALQLQEAIAKEASRQCRRGKRKRSRRKVMLSEARTASITTEELGASNVEERREFNQLAGFIFLSSAATKMDCFKYRVFGFPEAKKEIVQKVKKGMKLFLFDIDKKMLHGIYKASSEGGMELVPQAFQRRFPAQVRFRILKDCIPLHENQFKHSIKNNYYSGSKFKSELTSEQVGKLMQLFHPLPPLHIKQNARGLPQADADREENERMEQALLIAAPQLPRVRQWMSRQDTGHSSFSLAQFPPAPPRSESRYPREQCSWYSKQNAAPHEKDFQHIDKQGFILATFDRLVRAEAAVLLYRQKYEEAKAAAEQARREVAYFEAGSALEDARSHKEFE